MIHTIKKLQLCITILILSFSYNTLSAQGIIIDTESNKWIAELPKPVKSRSILPPSASLESYAPSVIDQTGTGMCASFALSTIHTMLYARDNNITNIDEIDKNRFSPTFLYYLFKDKDDINSTEGMITGLGIVYMSMFGLPPASNVEEKIYFPFGDKMIGGCYPYNKNDLIDDIKKGSQYVLDINSITSCGEMKEIGQQEIFIVNHDALKSKLSEGNPCLLGASFGPDFFKKEQEFCYSKTEGKSVGVGHAMVIVAYDDNKYGGSYKILNSYGEDWGCDGYTWIKYKDLTLLDGYIISFNSKDTYKEVDEKEINNFLTIESLGKALAYKDDCPEEELNNDSNDKYIQLAFQMMNNCKELVAQYGLQSKKADEFCECFVNKSLVEAYVNELFGKTTSAERFTELAKECFVECELE